MKDLEKEIEKLVEKSWTETEREWKKVHAPNIEKARASIKHPHFKYAVYDTETQQVTYRLKNIFTWFSGERIVEIKMKIKKFKISGLSH